MSLFQSFKKALGFPEEYDDLDDIADLEDADEANTDERHHLAAEIKSSEATGGPTVVGQLTETIVRICDDAADSDDARIRIDAALREAFSETYDAMRDRIEKNWQREKADYTKELSGFRKSAETFDAQRRKYESERLSSDRQKRALNDRIADRENRISELEAEREQLLLENQCMVNKLRGAAMPVVNTDTAGKGRFEEENAALRRELNQIKRQLASYERRFKEKESDDRPTADEIREIEEKMKQFEVIKKSKDLEIERLTNRLAIAETSNEELGSRLTKATAQIEDYEATIKTMSHTIEANLTDHAVAESELNKEITRLRKILDTPQQTHEPKKRGRKKKETPQQPSAPQTVRISAIDELMDNTDWFSAPEPGPRIKDPEVIENFGYKEQPKKQPKKYDENQLTLF